MQTGKVLPPGVSGVHPLSCGCGLINPNTTGGRSNDVRNAFCEMGRVGRHVLVCRRVSGAAILCRAAGGINIRGQLLDVQCALPACGSSACSFLTLPRAARPSATITGSGSVARGSVQHSPCCRPGQLLAPEAWYEVAVASGILPGPLTGADLFPNRVSWRACPSRWRRWM